MKKLLLCIALVAFTLSSFSQGPDVPEDVKNKLKNSLLSGANSLGKKFVIAFPKNEIETHPTQALDVYIATSEDTQIRIYNNLTGFDEVLNVAAGEIGVLSTAGAAGGQLNWGYEVREVDQVIDKGFTIVSETPISVYVMNSKSVSTEGYLAIPVSAWGTEYRHCSYYDFDEVREWASGFVIIASEDDTQIDIDLKGIGEFFPAMGGRRLGDSYSITMDEGEVYMLTGTGTTRGQFDMSGSLIAADKPIGLLSFHERTMIPATVVNNGRDHLVSMMPPTQAWGTKYTSVEIDRGTNKGDFFRIMAKEDNTEFLVRWYDKQTGNQIGIWDGVLEEAGDFLEYHPNAASECGNNTNSFESIRGTSIFTSVKEENGVMVENKDKPIFVMQYSYSACWDDAGGNYDPFMFPVSTVQQFTKSTIFQTPSNKSGNEYVDNFLNLIIQGDPDDPDRNIELLQSVKYDGIPITTLSPGVFGNEIADGLYWLTINPELGPHTLEGEARFGGYIYGFASFDSYGWPAATAYANLGIQDTLPPVITKEQECYTFKVKATEFRDQAPLENEPPQVDQHITDWPQVIENDNFKIWENGKIATHDPEREDENWFADPAGDDDLNLIFEVDDPTRDARLIYSIADQALNPNTGGNNVAYDTLIYFADKITVDPEPLDFGLVRIGTSKTLSITITSDKEGEINLSNLEMQRELSQVFTFAEDIPEFPITLNQNESVEIPIVYTPTEEWFDARMQDDDQRYDADSIFFSTDCVEWSASLKGKGGENYMTITDWRNAAVPSLQNEVLQSDDKIVISNWNDFENRPATWPLTIDGIYLDRITDQTGAVLAIDPFSVQAGQTHSVDANGDFVNGAITFPAATAITDEKEEVVFEQAEFVSAVDGIFSRNIPFKSDAKIIEADVADDTTSLWDAAVISSDAFLTSENWSKTRVGISVNIENSQVGNGYLVLNNLSINNTGNQNAQIEFVEIRFADGERVGDTRVDAWTSLNPDNGEVGEFTIRTQDPNNPRWENHFNTFLTDNKTNVGVSIYPAAADDVPQNAYRGAISIPVEFTPKGQYDDNNTYVSREYTVEAIIIKEGKEEVRTGTLYGVAYLPKINIEGDALPQVEAVLAGTTYEEELLEVPVTNTGTNSDLFLYGIENSVNIDWTGIGDGVSDFIFIEAESDFDPREPAMSDDDPFALAQGETRILRFQFSPTADEAIGEKTASFDLRHNGDIEGVEPHNPEDRDQAQLDGATLSAWVKEVGVAGGGTDFPSIIECEESDIQYITFVNSGDEPFRLDAITDNAGNDIGTNYPWYIFYQQDEATEVDITFYQGQSVPARVGGVDGELQVPVRFRPAEAGGLKPLPDLTVRYNGNFVDDGGNDIEERTQEDIILTAGYYSSKLDFGVNDYNTQGRSLSALPEITNVAGENLGINVVLDRDFDPEDEDYDELQINYIEFVVGFRNDQLVQLRDNDGNLLFDRGGPVNNENNWQITAEVLSITDTTFARCQSEGPDIEGQYTRVKYTLQALNGEYLRGNGDLVYPHYQVTLSECPDITVEVGNVSVGTKDACVFNEGGESTFDISDCISEYRAIDPNVGPEYNSEVEVTTSAMKIKYDIGISYQTKIEIVDTQGNVVATPVNGFVEQGKHEIEVPLSSLSSGAHFVRISSLTYQESQKVMVVK